MKVRPGLSGIGSIVFRSEEDMMDANADPDRLYDDEIMPYKGNLESWYVRNNSVWNYLLLIALTILVIFTRSTRLIFLCYTSLPRPPEGLNSFIASDYYE
jgi:lipopolysaccharide/colanic/teichoic acid biosynthesis glycosyltransferase